MHSPLADTLDLSETQAKIEPADSVSRAGLLSNKTASRTARAFGATSNTMALKMDP